jgi:D-alanyl-D-alanine carboxypeptidase/D-alanyl-D-alanine-endopeptidase (penicillin-binding protein 4)
MIKKTTPLSNTPTDMMQFLKALQTKQPHSSIGVYVLEEVSGKSVIDFNGNLSLTPASIMKIITTSTALMTLGENYVFETKVEYTGTIDVQHTLQGNIFIEGSGDPTLGVTDFEGMIRNWVAKIKEKGIRKVNGHLVADDHLFTSDNTPHGWTWEDMGNYYGAGVSGLNVHQNQYSVIFKPGSVVGSIASVMQTVPEVPHLEYVNEMKTGEPKSGDNGYIYGSPYTHLRYFRGTIPLGPAFPIKGSIPDPGYFLAWHLKKELEKNGITFTKDIVTTRNKNDFEKLHKNPIYVEKSEPLVEIIKKTNEESINLYAETLFRLIGLKLKKDPSLVGSSEAIIEFWKAKGLNLKGLFMEDGSGLSRTNAISPKLMSEILLKIHKEPIMGQHFAESLPIAGISGTMRGICHNQLAAGKIKCKSGSMTRVRSYAGYAKSITGKHFIFTIIINNYDMENADLTKQIEEFLNKLSVMGVA